jgi:hypothetical protein
MRDTGGPRCRPAVAYLGEDYPVSCVFTHASYLFTRASCVLTSRLVRAHLTLADPVVDGMTLG